MKQNIKLQCVSKLFSVRVRTDKLFLQALYLVKSSQPKFNPLHTKNSNKSQSRNINSFL